MESNHKLGLFVSYYLARFDVEAYQNLGYGNQSETHEKIGNYLSVNPHTVKNWRDEFDPLFGHRAGWYQRPMSPSRVRVVQALESLDEPQVLEIVKDILLGKVNNDEEELRQLLNVVTVDDNKEKDFKFVLRAPTGRQAEEYFINYFNENKKPIDGKIIDCRDFGVGYDFKIESLDRMTYVEVKGLSDFSGGVLFTNKEWTVAKAEGDNYFLCIISNLRIKPEIVFIQNPSQRFNAKKSLYTSIQIQWSLSESELKRAYAK
jgi:hypothetical protein